MKKKAGAANKARTIWPSLSCRWSRRLLASSQSQLCSTMHRTLPSLDHEAHQLSECRADAVALEKPAIVVAAVACNSTELANGGPDDLGQAQQVGEVVRLLDVRAERMTASGIPTVATAR